MAPSVEEQLVVYLKDAHSIEEQALTQLRRVPKLAAVPELAAIFEDHLTETEEHERLVSKRLEAYDSAPSSIKDTVMKAGGAGFVLFAQAQPDTPGKLLSHAYSYEALEFAAYELLRLVAERVGDEETVETARRIRDEERSMADRLYGMVDRAARASLDEIRTDDPRRALIPYLADAHAIEAQAIQLLEKGPKIAGDKRLAQIYAEHLEETRGHQELMAARLESHDAGRSAVKDAGMAMGALNWGMFFQAQRDTPGKLLAFAYAFEHLEIAGYELLKRVAQRADDEETVETVERVLSEERAAAEKIALAFHTGAEASLEALGAIE